MTHALRVISPGEEKGPINPLFQKFRNEWDQLKQAINYDNLVLLDWRPFLGSELEIHILAVKQYISHVLRTETFARGDYLTLSKLIGVFLGVSVPNFKFTTPVAISKSRFVQRSLYYLSIYMLSRQLDFIDNDVRKECKEASTFIAIFFGEWFLQSSKAHKAFNNDINKIRVMHLYKKMNLDVATSVLIGMARHLQYLAPENAVFALVDQDLDNETRSAMARKVLSIYLTTEDHVFSPKAPDHILGNQNFTIDAGLWEEGRRDGVGGTDVYCIHKFQFFEYLPRIF